MTTHTTRKRTNAARIETLRRREIRRFNARQHAQAGRKDA